MDYKAEAGRRIKAARLARNLSLESLKKLTADRLSGQRISNYEQGLRMPGPHEALILGEVLGYDPAHFLCVDRQLNPQEQRLLRDFRALPEKDRNDYVRRIEALASIYREPVPDEKLKDWKATSEPEPSPKKKARSKK